MNPSPALLFLGLMATTLACAIEPSLPIPNPASQPSSRTAKEPRILLTQAASELERPARKPDILYVPTPQRVVDEMLSMANVGKEDVVYDLGCGDGRIVITAAQKFGAKGVGIDIDPQRIREARENAQAAGALDRVTFQTEDMFKSELKDATVVSMYLLTSLNLKLRPKILAETKPGTRVITHAFAMGEWQPDDHKIVEGSNVYCWVVPANISGQWKVDGEGQTGIASVNIEQNFQKITGTVDGDGQNRRTGTGTITGNKFTFTLAPEKEGGQPLTITGRINGDQIEANTDGQPQAKWTAQRDPATKRQIAGTP